MVEAVVSDYNISRAYIQVSACSVTTAGHSQAHSTPPPNNQHGELDNIISLEEFRNLLSLGPISTLNDDLNFFCSILVSVYAAV